MHRSNTTNHTTTITTTTTTTTAETEQAGDILGNTSNPWGIAGVKPYN
jgi:hypothetical protein